MNRRLATVLFVAFLFAFVCAWIAWRYMVGHVAASRPIMTTKILAAANDLKIGTVIASTDLTTMEVVGQPPQGALIKPEGVVGRGVISAIGKGEPLFEIRLAAPGSGGGLASTIPNGKRAIAIRVDEVAGVAGFATPGMHVDVLASGNPTNSPDGVMTRTLLQNVEVLSAGTEIQKDPEGKPKPVTTVSLLVTPEEAQRVSLAGNQLKMQLVLRNPLDTEQAPVNSIAMSSIFGTPAAPAPVHVAAAPRKVEPKSYDIEVINGTSQEKVSAHGGKKVE